MERFCKNCESKLYGRADQKFCSDQCRNEYNNKINGKTNNLVRRVNAILSKNRHILGYLNPHDKTKVHKSSMIESGFDFNYFTNIYETKRGNTYYFCYDQGYLYIENDYYALVKRQDYIK